MHKAFLNIRPAFNSPELWAFLDQNQDHPCEIVTNIKNKIAFLINTAR